eukprot:8876502-Prorocentrum_lima.AAC.1
MPPARLERLVRTVADCVGWLLPRAEQTEKESSSSLKDELGYNLGWATQRPDSPSMEGALLTEH